VAIMAIMTLVPLMKLLVSSYFYFCIFLWNWHSLFNCFYGTSFLYNYEGCSINKLQNGTVPLILKIGKIRNIRFLGNLILKIHRKFFDDDVIIVTSSIHRTQSICVLFSPPVFYHNSQVINSRATREKTNKLKKLMLPL